MPCTSPLHATYVLENGKKRLTFSNVLAEQFKNNVQSIGSNLQLPCGRCISCRLERSRQWAVRIMHEAQLYDDNAFVTLTYDDEHLPADGSLVKDHFIKFFKRLRKAFVPTVPKDFNDDQRAEWMLRYGIRYYHVGEYGEQLCRPHYHAILFNFWPNDAEIFSRGENPLYVSDKLEDLWGYGFVSIGGVTFDSAAYVSRYCTKIVTGDMAHDHYKGKLPEYSTMSRRPGIGRNWFDRYSTDVYPSDNVIVNNHATRPPRYYDERLKVDDPQAYEFLRLRRQKRVEKLQADLTFARLADRDKVAKGRLKTKYRTMEMFS
ncbi:MAG: replication initiator protein [Microvirus sp.]|nr:MAG: replication initiator protein [Microvirus sp.]